MRRALGWLVLALTVLFSLAPAFRGVAEFTIRVHHLLHAVILLGAACAALLMVRRKPAPVSKRAMWLLVTILAPMFAMMLMWPSEYSPLDKLPMAHSLEHLGLVFFGFITAYAGQKYGRGVGVAMSFSMLAMAFLAAWGFGVSPPSRVPAVAAVMQTGLE